MRRMVRGSAGRKVRNGRIGGDRSTWWVNWRGKICYFYPVPRSKIRAPKNFHGDMLV